MEAQDTHTIEKLFDGVFVIHEMAGEFACNAFLVLGSERMLLIDTGMGLGNIKKFIESISELEGAVVLTHAHEDHSGGAGLFSEVHMSPADFYLMHKHERRPKLVPMWEGSVFDLGSRTLEVIWLPGHTPGSVALLDRKNRLLFAGDTISEQIHMSDGNCDFAALRASLAKLREMSMDFDYIISSHGTTVLEPEVIERIEQCTYDIEHGRADSELTISGPGENAYFSKGIRFIV